MRKQQPIEQRALQFALLGGCTILVACFTSDPTDSALAGLRVLRCDSAHFARRCDLEVARQVEVDAGTGHHEYSTLWLGLIELPTSQLITFSAETDDGLRLVLGGTVVIDDWSVHGPRRGLFKGGKGDRVPLRLEHFPNGGTGYLRLYWKWEGHLRELIPSSALFHSKQQETKARAIRDGTIPPIAYRDRSLVYQPNVDATDGTSEHQLEVQAGAGPHLLLDDYLIAESNGVERVVMQPSRAATIPNPIVTGPEDRSVQPYLTVLRDPDSGRYRMWYGAWRDDKSESRTHLATLESNDGVNFERPHQICDTPEIQFGSEVIDRGRAHSDPATRYVYSYWFEGGTRILASADGYSWRPLVEGVVLRHDHDISGIDWDPLRETYVATVSTYMTGLNWSGRRRTTLMSFSDDLIQWRQPWYVLTASDELDEGETQFYAMDGYLTRGSSRIAMVKILRDDLRAAGADADSFGRAHTSLAWSRDGVTWVRDRAMFFEPDDNPGSWDHAHAWIDEQLIVGDEVYLYYSGYKGGHKANRFEERQIGLVKMPLDRYVARRARRRGMLRTVPFRFGDTPGTLTVNADASAGELRVRLRDPSTGQVIPGTSFADCEPISRDGLRQPVRWREQDLASLAGEVIEIEFRMRGVDLFAFEFVHGHD